MAGETIYNPAVQTPAYDFKPGGGLGGWLYGNDLSRAQAMQPYQDQMTRNAAAESGINLEDLSATHALAAQARNAQNLADIATVGRSKEAATTSAEAKAKQDKETVDAKIATTLAEEAGKQGDLGLQELDRGVSKMSMISQAMKDAGPTGPHSRAALEQAFRTHGIDTNDPLSQQFLQSDPQHYQEMVDRVHKAYDTASSQVRSSRALQAQKDTAAMARVQEQGRTSRDVATIQANARMAQLRDSWSSALKSGNPTQIMIAGQTLLANPEFNDPIARRQVEVAIAAADKARRTAPTNPQRFDIKGLTTLPPESGLLTPPPQGGPVAAPVGGGLPPGWSVR